MTLLRRGITGFDAPSMVDFRAFKKAVHAAAQAAGASVLTTVAADGVTPNFHQADVIHGNRDLAIICNRNFPIVAFVKRPIDMSGVQPIDVPELAVAICESGFEVALAAELERPLDTKDLEGLSKEELTQVKYWQPKRLGQLIFNWWD